jgi:hypothetical protein
MDEGFYQYVHHNRFGPNHPSYDAIIHSNSYCILMSRSGLTSCLTDSFEANLIIEIHFQLNLFQQLLKSIRKLRTFSLIHVPKNLIEECFDAIIYKTEYFASIYCYLCSNGVRSLNHKSFVKH